MNPVFLKKAGVRCACFVWLAIYTGAEVGTAEARSDAGEIGGRE